MNADKIITWPEHTIQEIEHGTVRGGSESGYVVYGASGTFTATVAFSCLVKPMAEDKVMYTRDNNGRCYILAILERTSRLDAVMSFPCDVVLESTTGAVKIAAVSEIDLATAATVALRAAEVNVSAVHGRLNILDMQASGDTLTGKINHVRLIANAVDVVAQRVTQRLKSCYRWVEEIEHVTAGQMLHKVRNLFSIRARQTAITAKDDVKIDGERVHLG